jgi:hypothetical protein
MRSRTHGKSILVPLPQRTFFFFVFFRDADSSLAAIADAALTELSKIRIAGTTIHT